MQSSGAAAAGELQLHALQAALTGAAKLQRALRAQQAQQAGAAGTPAAAATLLPSPPPLPPVLVYSTAPPADAQTLVADEVAAAALRPGAGQQRVQFLHAGGSGEAVVAEVRRLAAKRELATAVEGKLGLAVAGVVLALGLLAGDGDDAAGRRQRRRLLAERLESMRSDDEAERGRWRGAAEKLVLSR